MSYKEWTYEERVREMKRVEKRLGESVKRSLEMREAAEVAGDNLRKILGQVEGNRQ